MSMCFQFQVRQQKLCPAVQGGVFFAVLVFYVLDVLVGCLASASVSF